MHASSVTRRLTVFASALALAGLACQAFAGHPDIDRVVAFGASLTDTGNAFVWLSEPANQHCGVSKNVPPYDALDDLLVPDGPYAKGGHHFTNGATWVEGLARDLALGGNARPAFGSAAKEASNYAVGGARAVAGYPCRVNLPDQVGMYLADFGVTPPRTLVAIEIGGNDVRDALVAAATGQDPGPYLANALGSLSQEVVRLYLSGAQRFLILNVPDIGRTPAVRILDAQFPGAAIAADLLAQAYNQNLAGLVQLLGLVLPGIDIRVLDLYATLNSVVSNPSAYGFVDVTHACVTPGVPPFACAKPDTYAFWDGTHPTKALHAIVAQHAVGVVSAP